MRITARELADRLGGQLVGDGARVVTGVASLQNAGPDDLAFVKNERMRPAAAASWAGVLLVPRAMEALGATQIVVPDPFRAIIGILETIAAERSAPPAGISPDARVAPDAKIAKTAAVGAFAVIGARCVIGENTVIHPHTVLGADCAIGRDCVLYPNVTLYDDCHLADRVIIHGGAVLGADGYGYLQADGRHVKIPQVGNVVIESDVEIGANTTIDRAALDSTVIRQGVKIDDHVHVAHNCIVGEHSLLVGGSKISGSTRLGKYVVLAGNVGVSDNVTIGDGAQIGGGSSVFHDVPAGAKFFGHPARPLVEYTRMQAVLAKLTTAWKDIRKLIGKRPGTDDE